MTAAALAIGRRAGSSGPARRLVRWTGAAALAIGRSAGPSGPARRLVRRTSAAALAIGRSAGPSGPARRLACAVVLASVAAAVNVDAAGAYRTVEMESLRITVDSEWVSSAAPGYVPVRWDITNLGDDRTIEIVGSGTRLVMRAPRYQQSSTSLRQRVRLAAGDRVRFTMTVPVGGYNDNVRFQIREGGRTIQSVGYVNPGRMNVLSALIVSAAD